MAYKIPDVVRDELIDDNSNDSGTIKVILRLPDCNVDKIMELFSEKNGIDPKKFKIWYVDENGQNCQQIK